MLLSLCLGFRTIITLWSTEAELLSALYCLHFTGKKKIMLTIIFSHFPLRKVILGTDAKKCYHVFSGADEL